MAPSFFSCYSILGPREQLFSSSMHITHLYGTGGGLCVAPFSGLLDFAFLQRQESAAAALHLCIRADFPSLAHVQARDRRIF